MERLQDFFEKVGQGGVWSTLLLCLLVALGAALLIRSIHTLTRRLAARGSHDVASINFIRRTADAVVLALAVVLLFLQIDSLQRVAVSLLASTGIIAVVLGFAAQQAMSNVIGGAFILISRPFSVHDRIRMKDHDILGIVEDITLRHTVIRTFENNRIIVPNSIMNSAIIENAHFQEEKVCQFFDVSIAYDADVDRAMEIIAELISGHPQFLDNRTPQQRAQGEPAVTVRVVGLGEYALRLRAQIWARDAGQGYGMVCDVNREVVRRFGAEGIAFPYPRQAVSVTRDAPG
jgi:small-conductance mechanosensitive channel